MKREKRQIEKLTITLTILLGLAGCAGGAAPDMGRIDPETGRGDYSAETQTGEDVIREKIPGAPESPSNVKVDVLSATEVSLTWKSNSFIEFWYAIERKDMSGKGEGSFVRIGKVERNVKSFQDTNGLLPNRTYAYRVIATTDNYASLPSVTASANTPDIHPEAPSKPMVSVAGSNDLRFEWKDNSTNEETFIIERRPADDEDAPFRPLQVVAANTTRFIDRNVEGSGFCYQVRAKNGIGVSQATPEFCGTFATLPLVADTEKIHDEQSELNGAMVASTGDDWLGTSVGTFTDVFVKFLAVTNSK